METHALDFALPPRPVNAQGKERRFGFELEFTGVRLDDIAAVILGQYGGSVERRSRFDVAVADTGSGTFEVVLDFHLLKSGEYLEYLRALDDLGAEATEEPTRAEIEDLLENLASTLVPYELVTPPLPFAAFPGLERLRETLRQRGAVGTNASPLYAFGLHINAEAPELTVQSILAHLRAYLLLAEWIRDESDVDITRRILPYIDDFPEEYARKALDLEYAPDLPGFMDDYLRANPTRNRGLDLLPLFCHLDCELVHRHPVQKHLVKPRPAYHYRLPNCLIGDPGWRVAREWNLWVEVELLAQDPRKLAAMSRSWLARSGFPGNLFTPAWAEWVSEVRRWLGRA